MSEPKVMANIWKSGDAKTLDGGSTGISACNPTKTDLIVFLAHLSKFLIPSKLIWKKKIFSLHPIITLVKLFRKYVRQLNPQP